MRFDFLEESLGMKFEFPGIIFHFLPISAPSTGSLKPPSLAATLYCAYSVAYCSNGASFTNFPSQESKELTKVGDLGVTRY